MADQPVVEAPAAETVNVDDIKSMLKLPETAKDIDVILALIDVVAALQQKYDALLSDAVELEDQVANRDVADFADIITPEGQSFWKDHLLKNREGAINILLGLRSAQAAKIPPQAPEPQHEQRPLFRNRLAAAVRTMSDITEEVPTASATRAVRIRNRAQQIRTSENVPYAQAFTRAEKEIE